MSYQDRLKKKDKTQKPFASTNLGIAVNTVTGLPKAAVKVGKDIIQGVARSGGQVGLSLTKTKELPQTKVSRAVFGEKPLTDIPTAIENTKKDLRKYKLSDKASGFVAPILVVGSIVGDLTGQGGNKKLLKDSGEEALEFFVKNTDTKEIKKVLQVFQHPEDTLDDVAESLSRAKTKDEVRTIIESSSVSPVVKPVGTTTSTFDEQIAVEESAVNKLLGVLKEARPLREQQEKLYTQARREKIGRVAEVREKTSGMEGFFAEKRELGGALPRVQFEGIQDRFNQEELETLFNMVKNSPRLDYFEAISAREGLYKMFQGQVPTNSEIKLMEGVFPKALITELLKKRPFGERLDDAIIKALNLPRALRSSFDLSAPLRQGIFFVGKKRFYQSFGQMFKQAFNEKEFLKMQDEIYQRPSYPEMKRANLAITELDNAVSSREEAFASNWAEKIPGFGNVVRASSRAYTGFLNKLRADVFDDILKKASNTGRDIEDEKFLKGIASYINAATGRGNLGKLERASGLLNGLLFSPRLMASRVKLLNPAFYIKADPLVRKDALKSLLSFGALGMTVLGIAKLGGAEVSDDPTSSDFGKIKIEDTRYDIFGGFQQYITAASRLLSGKMTSSTSGNVTELGEGYNSATRLDIATRFFRGKFNPIASFVADMLAGKDIVGKEFEPTDETIMLFTPLIIENLIEIAKEDPELLPSSIFSIFGVGMQTYTNQEGKGYLDRSSKTKSTPSYLDRGNNTREVPSYLNR